MSAPTVEWFNYGRGPDADDDRLRPMLPLILESPRRRLFASGLLDSGADYSVLPSELAHRLRMTPRRADGFVKVLGSRIPVGQSRITAAIPFRAGDKSLGRIEFCVPVPPIDLPFVVLGREPFFSQFEIRFQEWRGRVGLMARHRAAQVEHAPRLGSGPLGLLMVKKCRHRRAA